MNIHPTQSPTAAICENAALFGAAPGRDDPDPREVWDADGALASVDPPARRRRRGHRPRRIPARRRTGIPPLGPGQHPAHAERAAGPGGRPARSGTEGPAGRAGRDRDQRLGARAHHRARPQPRRPARRVRAVARRRRGTLPRRHRQHLAAQERLAHVPHLATDLRGHRRPGLPARARAEQDPGEPARGDAGRGGRVPPRSRTPVRSTSRWTGYGPSTPT